MLGTRALACGDVAGESDAAAVAQARIERDMQRGGGQTSAFGWRRPKNEQAAKSRAPNERQRSEAEVAKTHAQGATFCRLHHATPAAPPKARAKTNPMCRASLSTDELRSDPTSAHSNARGAGGGASAGLATRDNLTDEQADERLLFLRTKSNAPSNRTREASKSRIDCCKLSCCSKPTNKHRENLSELAAVSDHCAANKCPAATGRRKTKAHRASGEERDRNSRELSCGGSSSSSNGTESARQATTQRCAQAQENCRPANCAKCQLLVRWTLAQSKIATEQHYKDATNCSSSCSDSDRLKTPGGETDELEGQEREAEPEVGPLVKRADEWKGDECGERAAMSQRQTSQTEAESAAGDQSLKQAKQNRKLAPQPPRSEQASGSLPAAAELPRLEGGPQRQEAHLLDEREVSAVELFLKSHKSSVYVCGCMANLYITRTHLVDNGRTSRPEHDGWRLNKTGIPVLIFDSGLAKNRQRKRLSVSLAERGSGFILWSDTIDHLSSYRAYNSHEHGSLFGDGDKARETDANKRGDTCETFHVMYLSSNHRVMVGLSFDDITCARLFLAQIELVCADPANIALSGPKSASSQNQTADYRQKARLRRAANRATGEQLGAFNSNYELPFRAPLVSKFLSSFRVAAKRPAMFQAQHVGGQQLAGGSWSTLKRAMRLARIQRRSTQTGAAPASSRADEEGRCSPGARRPQLDERTSRLVAAFKPRPLAQLAAAGRNWRRTNAGRVALGARARRASGAASSLPEKSDISAPCLFQHVTRVDSDTLANLYSRSLVAPSRKLPPPPRLEFLGCPQGQEAQHRPAVALISGPAQDEPGAAERATWGDSAPANARQAQSSRMVVCTATRAQIKGSSLSSSSSCYSSASISPASSECGAQHQHQPARRQLTLSPNGARLLTSGAHRAAVLQQRRPPIPPPDPPTRTAGAASGQIPAQAHQQPTISAPDSVNKIGSIIKDLQSHHPVELINAKRRLMAELVADQVVAVGRQRRGPLRDRSPELERLADSRL